MKARIKWPPSRHHTHERTAVRDRLAALLIDHAHRAYNQRDIPGLHDWRPEATRLLTKARSFIHRKIRSADQLSAQASTDNKGLKWEYVEAPPSIAHNRPDLPRSQYEHGVISTDRPLTPDERDHFDLQLI